MDKKIRRLGWLTCGVISLLALALSFRLWLDVHRGSELVKVRFNNVGTLIRQDPVSMNGVTIGWVRDITYTGDAALVTLEFFKRLDIPKDSRIVNFNHSLMGARMIFIDVGSSHEKMEVSEVQQGVFDEGIAEMLYKSDILIQLVKTYQNLFHQMLHGDVSQASLIGLYRDKWLPLAGKFDTLTGQISEWQTVAIRLANEGHKDLAAVHNTIDSAKPMLRSIEQTTNQLINTTENQLNSLDSLLIQVKAMQAELQNPHGIAGKLIYQGDIMLSLYDFNHKLNGLLQLLSEDGVSDLIHLWRNVHVIGTNPTKKKISH